MGPLEGEIEKLLDQASEKTTLALESLYAGEAIQVTALEVLGSFLEIHRSHREAILRLATEIDKFRAALEGRNDDGGAN